MCPGDPVPCLGTLWRLGLCEGSHAPGSWLLVLTQPSLPWALPQAQLPRQRCFSIWDPVASPTITAGTCRWPVGFSGGPGLALSPSSTDTSFLRLVGRSLGQKEAAEPWLVGITCPCRRSPHVVQCLQPCHGNFSGAHVVILVLLNQAWVLQDAGPFDSQWIWSVSGGGLF